MNGFRARQLGVLGIIIVALLVALAGSAVFRGLLVPPFWEAPFYINPVYILTALLYGGFGLLMTSGSADGGWPWYVAFLGLWTFIVAFEDSILQWFVFQFGIATTGGRINPLQMTAVVAAFGAAIMLHVNQLGRRVHEGLADRGLDPRELREVETRSFEAGAGLVTSLVAILGVASVALFIGELILGGTSVGLGALGILGGIVIVGVIAMLAYGLLRQGPVPGVVIEPGSEAPEDGYAGEPEMREERTVQRVSGGTRGPRQR